MTKIAAIADVLQGKVAVGEKVTVRGWYVPAEIQKQGFLF